MIAGLRTVVIYGLALFLSACAFQPKQLSQEDLHKHLIELNIDKAQALLATGQTSCTSLTQAYLQRIQALDQPTGLNAIIYINPRAIKRAAQLEQELEQTGKVRKLFCMPVILKDNFDTADMPTEAGSIAMKDSIPPDDAFMVKKLREAGAIIIAKSNMGEWAFSPYNTISSTHGETRNAYDLERVPAGSSGGTASAIAANFGIIGMGTDTGNSIRGPASHLSLVGIRSTIGATSRDGVVPLLLNRDIAGPLMRTVKDTASVYSVVAGYDPADPATHVVKDKEQKDYTEYLRKDGLKGVRIGVMRELYQTPTSDPEVMAIMEQAIADLEKAGAVIVDPFEVFDFANLKSRTGFCSRFRYDLYHYLQSFGEKAQIRNLDEVVAKKLFRQENHGAMKWAMDSKFDPKQQEPPCVDVENDPRRKALLDAVVEAMNEHQLEAIVYPSWSNPPRKIGDEKSPHGNNSPIIAPHTGQPAITVPMGFTKNGLPLGLQFLARPFEEHKLFQYAYAYEQLTRHRRPPKLFGAL